MIDTTRRIGLFVLLLAMLAGCDDEPYEEPRQIDDPVELPPPADALEAAIRERAPEEAMLMIPHEPVVRGELAEGERRDFTSVLRAGLSRRNQNAGRANTRKNPATTRNDCR